MQVCRLCLAIHTADANFEIFKVHETRIRIEIMACTSLEMDEDDDLPQTICTDCRLRLEEYYNFRRRCQAADRRLRLKNKRKSADADLDEEDEAEVSTENSSNDNVEWRLKAAQLIRGEMESFKKELHSVCKEEVRQDIEAEVRAEVEEMVLAEAKKQCRLNVLDDLFCELERFFIRKRNEAVYDHVSGSEGYDGSEIESASTSTQIGHDTDAKRPETEVPEDRELPHETGIVVELLDDTSSDQEGEITNIKPESGGSQLPVPEAVSSIAPMTMVEINMQDTQLSHLREDLNISNFLKPTSTSNIPKKARQVRLPSISEQILTKPHSPKVREHLCRKHSRRSKQTFSQESLRNCVRCRLRGADKLHTTTS
ncbi:uncharacterized protein Dwil_GK12834 [Drosophila willistoni]|uniref:ZAD domain-containing protein n=1 Tax=Drosophila willistoni TaxID=7260 RepID=B4NJP2_DROWI|nr:uncharacterized protein LOC6650518 [Drosophila willistoni]EDW85004.2 uncharacterized protein Dwil_GK12834 [Drosophila willistoni]